MYEYIVAAVRDLVSPSLRYEARETAAWLREQLSKACLWNWEVVRIIQQGERSYGIIYIGRKGQQNLAKALLNTEQSVVSSTQGSGSDNRVIVSEMPIPGAMCVPAYLSSIVPLGRPVEEITSNYHSQLRRELKKNRTRYRLQQVLDSAEIERVDRDMLRPYAIARHDAGAAQLGLDEVKKMAQKYGRLDLLLLDDEVVGCQLGHVITRAGKRYWSSNRFGYPEAVFSDPKRLRETNSMNLHIALEWALENGYDYYDIGVALGRPGDGLLEWKRRRGGELDTMGNRGCFYISPPKAGAAQFFWDAPLFAVEQHKLTLHLGLPDGLIDEEVASRYREMGFGGLSKIYLHCVKPPGEQLVETLRSYYVHQKPPPVVEIITAV